MTEERDAKLFGLHGAPKGVEAQAVKLNAAIAPRVALSVLVPIVNISV